VTGALFTFGNTNQNFSPILTKSFTDTNETAGLLRHEHGGSQYLMATHPLWLDFQHVLLWPSHGPVDLPMVPKPLVRVQCHVIESFVTPSQIMRATECFATPRPTLAMSLVQAQHHAAKFYTASCLIHGKYLMRAQCHAATFSATPRTTLHGTEFFTTPRLILGTLLHVLKTIAIESQKLISNTSDVVDTKVITTGEATTPHLLVNIIPSINDTFAGGSLAHSLLRAQSATSQRILRESIDFDDLLLHAQLVTPQCTQCKAVGLHLLNIGNENVSKLGIRPTTPCPRAAMCYELCILCMTPCLTVLTRSLLAHQYDLFFEAYKGDHAEVTPEKVVNHDGRPSCILPVTQAITKYDTSGELITMDLKTFAHV